MKKRFLPFSLLLVIMILGQSITIADNGGHYVPRTQGTATAEQFMSEMRANQNTGLIDPAWMIKAAQNQSTRDASDDPLYWLNMGPDNMGGQATAIVYDNKINPNTGGSTGVVYIGSKGGGVYKTYNYGITWHQVGDKDLMVSCMAQAADGTIYVGTGDGSAAVTYNGLSEYGYDNSFVGSGIYKIVNDEVSVLPSTVPSINAVSEWSFVNDIVMLGNTILAATNEGLKSSNDNGATWATVLEGVCMEVKVASDNTLVVSCDGKIYIGTLDNLVCHSANNVQYDEDGTTIIAIPQAAGLLDVATAPTNAKTIYASVIAANGRHSSIYVSYDKGETWKVALPSTDANIGHDVYSGFGLYNHGLVVDPSNSNVLYVLGYNLWKLEKPESDGYFMTSQITSGSTSTYYESSYLHVGLHAMTFNPSNAKECYVGTDGGIFKATIKSDEFVFSYCNRNYLTTRMTNVAMSGSAKRILASGLDHGIVYIAGVDGVDSESHGKWINPSGYNNGSFDDGYHGGPSAISLINPNTFIVTSKGGSLNRTETAGGDWVSTNFTSSESYPISLESLFRTPILLFENFNDPNSVETVTFKNKTGAQIPAGTTVQVMSQNNYPMEYTLTAPLADKDSIEVRDHVTSKLYVATTNKVYLTRIPLLFAKETEWIEVSKKSLGFVGTPLCLAISADGDNLFVGTAEGKLYRLSNLNTVVDSISSVNTDPHFQVTTTAIEIAGSGQCITSVAVDPKNANNVIVTLGNYGNDNYVYYSTNALADEPTFVSKQANLGKMPVYSSVIEMTTGHVIIGTERGIYRTKDINNVNWVADSKMLGEVPVMELKQQLVRQEDKYVVLINGTDTVVNVYPGVKNTGIVYAATYGHGTFRCENYKLVSGVDVPEMPAVVAEKTVSIYPNPVVNQATAQFEAEGTANVSYQVYDLMGRMVMNQNLGRLNEGVHEIEINMSDLSTGSYILRISEGARIATAKFLVY